MTTQAPRFLPPTDRTILLVEGARHEFKMIDRQGRIVDLEGEPLGRLVRDLAILVWPWAAGFVVATGWLSALWWAMRW
ncbi:MAG: hypothetical protein RX318_03825 [bacterium]|nr:hypothetical protein [bacterium]